jgi:hypothetical protein
MIAHIAQGANNDATITPPSGWVQIQRMGIFKNYTTSGSFWKIADSSDVAASNFTFTVPNANNIGAISTFTGANVTTPIGTSSIKTNTAGDLTICTASTITPPVGNCMIVFMGTTKTATSFSDATWTIATSPPTFSEKYDTNYTLTIGMACGLRSESTATDNGTVTIANSMYNIGTLIAIQP